MSGNYDERSAVSYVMRSARAAWFVVGLAAILASDARSGFAQAGPTFDVVSVKLNTTGDGGGSTNVTNGRYEATHVTLKTLMGNALGVRFDQISGGPAWMEDDRYDVIATFSASGGNSDTGLQARIAAMLADRFQLKFHRETKQLPVYSLVLAKGGPKLKDHSQTDKSTACGGQNGRPGICIGPAARGITHRDYVQVTAPMLADNLGRMMDRPVVDNTGLKGEYDFSLEWARNPDSDQGPTLFTAIEQLGLRLESTKGPVEVIMIDAVQKASPN